MIMESKLIQAKYLKVVMILTGQRILNLEKLKQFKKISVITEEGTILANGLLTTTICGDYLDGRGNTLSVLEEWKKDHNWLM